MSSTSLTTTGGHKITTNAFIDAERYYCPNQEFRDNLITDNRAAEGLLIYFAPTKKVMYLQTLVFGNPTDSIWKDFIGTDSYKGRFTSQTALNTAIPVGEDGWEAIIDTPSQDAYIMLWDVDDTKWVRSGSNVVGITTQQAADIESNNAARVTIQERVKFNNQVTSWLENEVLSMDMGTVIRIYNGELEKYIGGFPFTTTDLEAEKMENPPRWESVISTFPAVEFGTLNPKSVQPNTTKWIQLNGANIIKNKSVLDLGNDITILQYVYESDRVLIEVQSNGNQSSIIPRVFNGKWVDLDQTFSISDGEILVPNVTGSEWESTHNQIIYTVGGWEADVSGAKYIGYFGEIPINTDFEYNCRINPTTDNNAQVYFGFKTLPTHVSANGYAPFVLRFFPSSDSGFSATSSTISQNTSYSAGDLLTLKRVMKSANTCDVEVYVNGVKEATALGINITEPWYPYFYTYTINEVTEIELKLL